MKLAEIDYEELPFSKLFQDYIAGEEQAIGLFDINPFDGEQLNRAAGSVAEGVDRNELSKALADFNKPFDLHENGRWNIERLRDPDTITLTTGQQMGVYGGPLLTFYKALSVVRLARRFTAEMDRCVVPVFWLADEDHDYREAARLTLPADDGPKRFQLQGNHSHPHSLGRIAMGNQLATLREQLRQNLYQTDFSPDVWELLDDCYDEQTDFRTGFGRLMARLFSRHGLILAGSDYAPLKRQGRRVLAEAVERSDQIHELLNRTSQHVAGLYHQQAAVQPSNLFFHDEQRGRLKFEKNGDTWYAGDQNRFTTRELLRLIDEQPERISPNVFLRPMLQEHLLPNLGYVAGPAETAYFAQMKDLFDSFRTRMPVIFPRLSATIIESAIDRLMHKLPFSFTDYGRRTEDLEQLFVARSRENGLDRHFEQWKQQVEQLTQQYLPKITEIDPTLESAAHKIKAEQQKAIDKLHQKTGRAIKKQNEIQLQRIHRIQHHLFPDRSMQEREIACVYFLNKYGTDLWSRLLDKLDDRFYEQHKLVWL